MSKTAIIHLGEGYGNIIMTTPTIRALWQLGYEVTALVRGNWKDSHKLIQGHPCVREVLTDLGQTRGRHWDVQVGTKHVGTLNVISVDKSANPTISDMRNNHESDVNLTTARQLGWSGLAEPFCMWSEYQRPQTDKKIVVLCSGYGGHSNELWRRKEWHFWNDLIDKIKDEYYTIVCGSNHDSRTWNEKCDFQYFGNPINKVAGLLKIADCVVSIDNGLAHISAALGSKIVVLFGATSEIKNKPIGCRVSIISSKDECRPCQLTNRWDSCFDWKCMKNISVEMVYEGMKHAD